MKAKFLNFQSLILTISVATITMFTSCNDDENPAPENKPELEAVLGFSPETPDVGEEITLDASQSNDEDDIGFVAEWSLLSKPQNSTTTIDNNHTTITTFTPDVAGDYQVLLKISNTNEGISDTTSTTITVLASGYVELNGAIGSDRILENIHTDPEKIDYLVTGDISVSAQLTVEPGVLVHFQENKLLKIEQNGTLIAEGTETDTIKFTTANKAGGIRWKGIFINSSTVQNSLQYTEISYAGSSEMDFAGQNHKAGLGINSGGNINIQNSAFSNNDGYAVYLDDDGGKVNTFANNMFSANTSAIGTWSDEVSDIDDTFTFTGNTASDVEIFSSTVNENTEVTWNALSGESSYYISGQINVNGSLTIAAGARFELDENVMINVEGALIASGSSESPITFTTSDDAQSLLWKGIFFKSADARNTLEHVHLSYAGNSNMDFAGDNFATGVGINQGAKLSIINSTFSDNNGYGVYVDDDGGILETFEANTFQSNDRAIGVPADEVDAIDGATSFSDNANADVEIFYTIYAADKSSTWQKLNGTAKYLVSGNLTIEGDLSIAPGAYFELEENVMITVNGSLIAEGTSADHITFTTASLDGGLYWKGILIRSGTSLNSFDYVDLSYAGNSTMNFSGTDYAAGIGVDEGAKVSVTNSTVTNNSDYGLYIDNDGGLLEEFFSNHFALNAKGIGLPADEIDALDGNTTFSENSFAEVEVFGSTLAGTKAVIWNALGGDAYYRVTGDIEIDGEVTIKPGASFEMDEGIQIVVDGAFIAEGTDSNMITFTSSNIVGGLLWQGFYFRSADARNSFDYATISYGGNSAHDFSGENFAANIAVNTDARLSITNSVISNSGAYGIYSKGLTNDFLSTAANNQFMNNANGNNL